MENYESIDKALNISDTDISPTKKRLFQEILQRKMRLKRL